MDQTLFNPTDHILDAPQICQKIKRMAFEIYENNFSESGLVLASIQEIDGSDVSPAGLAGE